ncbi:3-oxo-tetronate kinase [Micrococcus luteus]|uniref:3-oxo-tetronate kinase n=1 Tax=Micrococcus luteus TaxID=1270 RepID=UPI00387A7CDB
MPLRAGVIADDFTGATDIAGALVDGGLRTVQFSGAAHVPDHVDADAVVISLKTRSIPPGDAAAQSLEACRALERLGAERIVFKYCSTFDSTAEGNIGPVTDALLEHLGEDFTVVAPALPVNGRTVYQGHLFVHDRLLQESGMKDHPVTPMRDSDLVRLMERQSSGRAASVPSTVVGGGSEVLRGELDRLRSEGVRYAVLDTLDDTHLDTIGAAVSGLRLTTGGSGLGSGLARSLTGRAITGAATTAAAAWRFTPGRTVVLSGSASEMTNRQVDRYRKIAPSLAVDVVRTLEDATALRDEILAFVLAQDGGPAPLVYATAGPDEVRRLQEVHGRQRVSTAIERLFGTLAAALRERGVSRFVVAGGETSGAVTQALGVTGLRVGPQIAPGVPWTASLDGAVDLALKSGNFGDKDFFSAAQRLTDPRT